MASLRMEDQPEPVVCEARNVCTPLSILEGLMTPRKFEKPSQAAAEEQGVEIDVTDTEGLSSPESPHDEEPEECDSTENSTEGVLSQNNALLEESEEPGQQALAEDGLGPAMSCPRRHYVDGTLPDLLRSGSPLRRRVSSPVSSTLKEVRREVELSRRRSLKLKAQVEKLQSQSDSNWSHHQQQVTQEVQSILKLLLPLTDVNPAQWDSSSSENVLDTTLSQLQQVARILALNHSKGKTENGDSAVLQQALRDRDEAVAKKKAMEIELLNSKTEMMSLNNQLLEAVQHRLELSLELEAWKEDFQLLLQQQVLLQQKQAEQSQKRGLLGTLGRKTGKAAPKPPPSPSPSPPSPPATAAKAPAPDMPKTPEEREAPNRWRVKLRRGRTSRGPDNTTEPAENGRNPCTALTQSPGGSRGGQFHTISLD